MSDQFLGEIRIVPFDFAPQGWAQCDGQILPISQFSALFSLLGTYYGGNGSSNFGLPNFQGNIPVDAGSGAGLTQRFVGETGGSAGATLLLENLPPHAHTLQGDSTVATVTSPAAALPAVPAAGVRKPDALYAAVAPNTQMQANNVLQTGGNQPHNNLQPFLVLNFVISLTGIYPQRP